MTNERKFMKTCTKCGKKLPLEDFSKNKTKKDGLHNECKSCTKAYEKARKQSPEYKAYEKTRRQSPEYKAYQKSYQKAYKQTSAGKASRKYHSHIRRALERGLVVELTQAEKLRVLAIEAECAELNAEMTAAGFDHGIDVGNPIKVFFHVDHIVPLSKGGTNHPSNLQILPAKINCSKGNR